MPGQAARLSLPFAALKEEKSEMAENAIGVQKVTTPSPGRTSLKLVEPATLFERVKHLRESIARRAFELFEGRGAVLGCDSDDWFKAEKELLHPVHLEITETDDTLTVRAEVPGFEAKELEVSVEPRRITISGKKEATEEKKMAKTVYKEQCSSEILRVVDLPVEIEAAKATATLKDGLLELRMPKTAQAKGTVVEVKRS
jgi:HSP20 family protein